MCVIIRRYVESGDFVYRVGYECEKSIRDGSNITVTCYDETDLNGGALWKHHTVLSRPVGVIECGAVGTPDGRHLYILAENGFMRFDLKSGESEMIEMRDMAFNYSRYRRQFVAACDEKRIWMASSSKVHIMDLETHNWQHGQSYYYYQYFRFGCTMTTIKFSTPRMVMCEGIIVIGGEIGNDTGSFYVVDNYVLSLPSDCNDLTSNYVLSLPSDCNDLTSARFDRWPSLTRNRYFHGTVLIGRSLMVCGGSFTDTNEPCDTMECLDVDHPSKGWTQVKSCRMDAKITSVMRANRRIILATAHDRDSYILRLNKGKMTTESSWSEQQWAPQDRNGIPFDNDDVILALPSPVP